MEVWILKMCVKHCSVSTAPNTFLSYCCWRCRTCSMYPFDKYYINTNIIASAWITGLTNMNQVRLGREP